jgi:hypothetical protein
VGLTLGLWLLLAIAWAPFGARRAYGDLYDGAMTDHASHLTRVRMLVHFGPRVWTTPARDLPLETLPEAHVNWPELPAMYPLGMFVLHAPLAALVELGALTLDRAAFFAIELYLLAFAALVLLLLATPHARSRAGDGAFLALLALGVLGFVLRGFYDVVPMVVLGVAFSQAARDRPERALVWWALAAFLHYRAFLTLPFAAWWALQALRTRSWKHLAASATLCTVSAATFVASARFLAELPVTNPTRELGPRVVVVVALAAWLGWSARRRQLLPGVLLALTLATTLLPRQTMSWHAFLIWPALLSFRETEPPLERWARYALGALVVFVGMRGEWPFRWFTFL